MDLLEFREKLANEDLKAITLNEETLKLFNDKYKEAEIYGTFRIDAQFNAIYFKQKLWDKLAFYSSKGWVLTRVASLKNKLPDATAAAVKKKLKKEIKIIRMESVISSNGDFYYFIVAKVGSQKKVLHVSREGEVLLNVKFIHHKVTIDEGDDIDEIIEEDASPKKGK